MFRSTATIKGKPGYPERSGEIVQVLRELSEDEVDRNEVGRMFEIKFSDGLITHVFNDELHD